MSTRTFAVVCSLVSAVLISAVSSASALAAMRSNPLCSRLGHSIQASSGAQMYCFGAQSNGPAGGGGAAVHTNSVAASVFSTNVDAASFSEDVSPGGVRGYGQSETSTASSSPYVVEAWNDATAFFSACPAPMSKEEGTGFAFSANGGASFMDLGGLPNAACGTRLLEGDPSVEAWPSGGNTYFYIASLYPSVSFEPVNELALNACKVAGTGSSATINCGQPIVLAASTECGRFGDFPVCGFLDKEYLTIDPVRGRLYVSYTEFGISPATFNGVVDLAVCDLGTPGGAVGPAGGTAGKPVCEHGTTASLSHTSTRPYLTIAPGDPNCENEGAYPAADVGSGDVYTAYEFNAFTNLFNPACFSTPTQNILTRVPASCLTLTTTSPCSGPAQRRAENIISLDSAFIPGYNRFPANDFPRTAVDDATHTVSMVWNDARSDPLGDILLRSYSLGTLAAVQPSPVRINSTTGGLHFLPAVRNASATGKLAISWYDRATPNTAATNLRAALSVDPRTTSTPANSTVTSVATNWNNVSSDIVPNFGDYTDNYARSGRVFFAWSDGRLGVPQPFEASAAMP